MNHRHIFRPWGIHRCGALLLALLLIGFPLLALARDVEPKQGQPAPLISGQSIDGQSVDTATLNGQVVIIQFAGTDHQRSLEEMTRLAALLHDPKLAAIKPVWLLILSTKSNPADLPAFKPDDKNQSSYTIPTGNYSASTASLFSPPPSSSMNAESSPTPYPAPPCNSNPT